MDSIFNMVCNLIRRGKTTLDSVYKGNSQNVQVLCMGKTKNIELVFPYGLYANLPKDSIVLTFNVNGQDENCSGIGYSPIDRFKTLKSGEVLVGNPKTGAYAKFQADGGISVYASGNADVIAGGDVTATAGSDINITASNNATITCKNCTIAASGTISLGSGGLAVARVGDAVQVNPLTGTGTITVGSTKVTSV